MTITEKPRQKSARRILSPGGRPTLSPEKVKQMLVAYEERTDLSIRELCDLYKISRGTLYNYVREQRQLEETQPKEQVVLPVVANMIEPSTENLELPLLVANVT